MLDNKTIRDMTETEFIDLLQNTLKGNHIQVAGVEVNSITDSLKNVEETVNRLIKKHKNFLLLRRELKLKMGFEN